MKVIIYSWAAVSDAVQWGEWEPGVTIRKVPASRYFQATIASFCYNKWIRKDNPGICAINFLYHGEQRLPKNYKYLYILNTPASEVPQRYAYIRRKLAHFPLMEFVAVSEMVKREATPYLPDRRVSVIFNGVDTDVFVPPNGANNHQHDKINVITAAALEERKGIQHLLMLLAKPGNAVRNNIQYDIYGDGAYKPMLEKIIRENQLDDCVSLHAPVNNLQEVLPRYDLFCLLSHGEAMPMAPLEAMACGLPVLCADVPPFDELITPEVGMAVNPNNKEKILDFLLHFRETAGTKSYSSAARKHSLLFSWDIIADKYEHLIREYGTV